MALLAPVAVLLAWVAFYVMADDFGAGLVLVLVAFVGAALVAYVARDAYAKWTLRAEFGATSVRLRLPAYRSHVHAPPAFEGDVAYADIAAVETRLEAYRWLGLAAMQRAYALRFRDGSLLILGEDRGLGSQVAQLGVDRIAAEIARRAGLQVSDLGMVEGRGGVALVAGAKADAWGAASLPEEAQARLWRRVLFTGAVPLTVFLAAYALSVLFG